MGSILGSGTEGAGGGSTVRAQIWSRGVTAAIGMRKTKNYYKNQEQLYGQSALSTCSSSLIARAQSEYRKMEDHKNRESILDQNKRKMIFKQE